MDIAATLTAIGGIVIAIVSFAVALFTQRSAATREELNSLRLTIQTLQEQNTRLNTRVDKLQDWAQRLCDQVRELGGKPVRMED